jgi:hypothetical protein
MITVKSTLAHNNGSTGYGKFYVAKLTGKDEKFTFKREFLNRENSYENSSKTTWVSYTVEINDNGFYEIAESNNYKSNKYYVKVENDEMKRIDVSEIKF